MKILQAKKIEYSQSFAIHGLSRIFHGTKHEKCFWFINLLLCFGISAFLVNSQVKSYFNKEVYNDEKPVVTAKTEFPTITICDGNSNSRKYDYCGYDSSRIGLVSGKWRCQIPSIPRNGMSLGYPGGVSFDHNPFKIYCGDNNCFHRDLLIWGTVANFSQCAQYNRNGDASTPTDRISFYLRWKRTAKKRDFVLYVHEQEDAPYATDFGALQMSYLQNIDIRIKSTKIKRLPAPYPSSCVTEEEGKSLNIFPGKYSLQACSETIRCIKTFKECGDTYNYCRPYIPDSVKMLYFNVNKTFVNFMTCLRRHNEHNTAPQCRRPCKETKYEIQVFPTPVNPSTPVYNYKIRLQFVLSQPGEYLRREEKPMFSWEDLLGIIGGTVGLFCGFSILSLIEFMIYLVIQLMSRVGHSNTDK